MQQSFVHKNESVRLSVFQPLPTCKLIESQAVRLPKTANDLFVLRLKRGIYVTLAWDFSRMLRHVKIASIYTVMGLAVVWLGSVLWAGHRGDWSTALAFGNLLAASLALLLHHT